MQTEYVYPAHSRKLQMHLFYKRSWQSSDHSDWGGLLTPFSVTLLHLPLCVTSKRQAHSWAWKGETTMEVRVFILPTPALWIPYCQMPTWKCHLPFVCSVPSCFCWVSRLQGRSGACHRESFWVGVKQKQILPPVRSEYLESSFKGNSHVYWEQCVCMCGMVLQIKAIYPGTLIQGFQNPTFPVTGQM